MLAALMLTAGPVAAKEDAAKKPKKERGNKKAARAKKARSLIRGEYAMLANEAGLTDEQKAQLEAMLKEAKTAQAQAAQANKEKLAELKKKIADAKEAKNKVAMKAAAKEMKDLRGAAAKAKKEFWAKVMALLTPKQKLKWAAFKLYRSACRRLAKAKMTDDQKAAARKLCDATAKQLGDVVLAEKTRENAKAIGQAVKQLQQKITAEILTAEQREAIKPKPREKREKPEKGEKKDRKKGKKKEAGGPV